MFVSFEHSVFFGWGKIYIYIYLWDMKNVSHDVISNQTNFHEQMSSEKSFPNRKIYLGLHKYTFFLIFLNWIFLQSFKTEKGLFFFIYLLWKMSLPIF